MTKLLNDKWNYNADSYTLTWGGYPYAYEIDLERIHSSADMLDWIMRITNKTWATDKCIRELCHAFAVLFEPQRTLCGLDQDKRIEDVAEFLATKACYAT